MKKTKCEKCQNYFSNRAGNYARHNSVCNGNYIPFVKVISCKYCNFSFDTLTNSERANHTRWCDLNPNKKNYIEKLKNNRKYCKSSLSDEHKRKLSNAHKNGKYSHIEYSKFFLGKKHTDKTKNLISLKARLSTHRRLVRSIRPYTKKDGSIVMLDSSWEEALAFRLDNLNINWIRPENPISYTTSDGKSHNYFPDFYLPEYDLFLDPKNPFALTVQKDKINILNDMMSNLIIIKSLEDCKNFNIL